MPGQGPSRLLSLDAKSADETFGVAFNAQQSPYVTFYITGNGTTSSGVVTIEEADWNVAKDTPFSGTWSEITTVNASDVSGGVQKAIHLPVANYHFVRPRISTVIGGGGTVSVVITGTGVS
jgi:hypothetical protein